MTLLGLILAAILFVFLYWLVGHLPIGAEAKRLLTILVIVVGIIVVVWLLLGLFPGVFSTRVR